MLTRLLFFCLLYLGCTFFLYRCCTLRELSSQKIFYLELCIVFVSVYLALFLAVLTPAGDSVYFITVLSHLTEEPFFGFYDRVGITYPPLFNYTFFLLGKLLGLLDIPFDWTYRPFIFIVKLPGICCLFLMAFLIYSAAGRHLPKSRRLLPLFLTLLNPGYLFVTCYICQADAIYSFFVLLTLCLIVNRRLKAAYFAFAAGILFKFQTVFIAPVIAFAIIDQVLLHNFSRKRFFSHLLAGVFAMLCIPLSYLPFICDFRTKAVSENGLAHNFTSSVTGYGRASTNAYNFWTLLGYNLKYDSNALGPLSCAAWGTLFVILLIILCACFFAAFAARSAAPDFYPLLAALLVSGIFCFSVRMMARYLYPAIILLILSYTLKPTKKRLLCTVAFSLAFFLNVWCDYMVYPYSAYHNRLILPYVISLCTVICFFGLLYTVVYELRQNTAKP